MTDGAAHEVRRPGLIMVGRCTVMIGLTEQPGQTFYERIIRLGLEQVIRIDLIEGQPAAPSNGAT
jgi:hypothetical protein